jgi:hypothetical protein
MNDTPVQLNAFGHVESKMVSKSSFVGDFVATAAERGSSVHGVRTFLAPVELASARRFPSVPSRAGGSFPGRVKELRQRFGGKQLWLATLAGCSDAAVSFWESGKRVPNEITFSRLLDGLTQVGAAPSDLAALRLSWLEAKSRQSEAKVRRCA